MADQKIALVTGGNKGIGYAITRQLAGAGFHVFLTARNREDGREAAERLAADGLPVSFVHLDVTDAETARSAVAEINAKHGRLDVVVNNAGILLEEFSGAAFDTPETAYFQTFETNTIGPLRIMREVLPLMVREGYGRIVNISSQAGQLSDMSTGYPAYRVSKAGLNVLTRVMAAECRKTAPDADIKINSMCPGWVKTDMGGQSATRTPEQGAKTAVWLAQLPADGPSGGFFKDEKSIPW